MKPMSKSLLLEKKAKMEADKIYERTIASNELKVRDSILRAKQSIIDKDALRMLKSF